MVGYALLLWLQTLAALAVLGLCGGWALAPFRRPRRPYLWLAAPLAGVPVLALALTFLNYLCGLPVPVCVVACVPAFTLATLAWLYRRGRSCLPAAGWQTAALALAGVSA